MKYFFMAALALMTAACSNEDNEITQQPQMVRGIPFTATLSMGNSAATRALVEKGPTNDYPYGIIEATWETGDEVALIYTVGSTTYKKDVTVTPQANGTATVSTTLEGNPQDGSTLTIIYPASAADKNATANEYVKTDFLTGQDGTLAGIAANFDVRTGKGYLSISDGKATVNNGTAGTLVKLENQYAILKFTLQDIRGTATDFKASELKVSSSTLNKSFSPSTASGEYYIALPGQTVLNVGAYWLNATIGDKAYVGKLRIDPAFTLGKGKFYPTTVQMATVGDYVLTSGKFAAATITENPVGDPVVAKISYVVNPSNAAANNHGLALALEDESPLAAGYGWQEAKELILSKCAPTSKTPVSDASWILPTKAQWGNMVGVNGAGSFAALRTLGLFSGYYYWTSTNYTEEGQTETDADPWWIVDFLQNKWGHNNVYSDVSIRLGLAF